MILLFIGVYYFMNNAQKKQQEQRKSFLSNIKVGDLVVTIGGLHGVVAEINTEKDTIFIDCEGIQLEFDRGAIKTVKPGEPVAEELTADPTVEEYAAEKEGNSAVENEYETKE